MKRYIVEILGLMMTLVLLFFGFGILLSGRILYGSDANLLWASGILTFIGLNGFGSFVRYLFSLKDSQNTREKKQ